MTRPIDADALKINIACVYGSNPKYLNWLNNAPTIDAVPVVRCRDCIFHKEKRCTVWRERAVIVECYTDDDGYCYKGLRKEHETD